MLNDLKIKIILLVSIITISYSCVTKNKSSSFFELVIIKEGKCSFQYKLNNEGFGVLNIGISSSYKDSLFMFDSIKKTLNIQIDSQETKDKYLQLINKLDKQKIKGGHNWDAWRCILKINDVTKIDVYGTQESKDLLEMLELVSSLKNANLNDYEYN